jgi:hypothetical protein
MKLADSEGRDVSKPEGQRNRASTDRVTDAKHTGIDAENRVGAPTLKSSVGTERTTKKESGANIDDISQPNHLNRRMAFGRSAVTQFSGGIVTPTTHGPIGKQRARVAVADRHRNGVCETDDLYRDVAFSGGVVAELSASVIAPAANRPVGAHGAALAPVDGQRDGI